MKVIADNLNALNPVVSEALKKLAPKPLQAFAPVVQTFQILFHGFDHRHDSLWVDILMTRLIKPLI